jgi:hypothetical protein
MLSMIAFPEYAFLLARTFMKSFICLRSMRPCSSRCSAAFSLLRGLCQPYPFGSSCLFETVVARVKDPRAFRWGCFVGGGTYESIPLMLDM